MEPLSPPPPFPPPEEDEEDVDELELLLEEELEEELDELLEEELEELELLDDELLEEEELEFCVFWKVHVTESPGFKSIVAVAPLVLTSPPEHVTESNVQPD